MATTYAYQLSYSANIISSLAGTVKFNATPSMQGYFGAHTIVDIAASVKSTSGTVKSVAVWLSSGGGHREIFLGYSNVTISSGSSKNISVTHEITEEEISIFLDAFDENQASIKANLIFEISEGAISENIFPRNKNIASDAENYYYNYIERIAPRIPSAVVMSDEYSFAVAGNTTTPLAFFGKYVKTKSVPLLSFTYLLDTRDPTLTATLSFVATRRSNGDEVYRHSITTSIQAASVIFRIPSIDFYDTYDYVYTVTDSAGLSNTETGSFDVYDYSPPALSDLGFFRYALDANNDPIDNLLGTDVYAKFVGSVAAVNSKNAWELTISYLVSGSSSPAIDYNSGNPVFYGTDGSTINSDRNVADFYLSGILRTNSYVFTVSLHDVFDDEAKVYTFTLRKSTGYFFIGENGVAVGMIGTGTSNDKRFEVAADYSSHFGGEVFAEGGISGVTNYASGEAATGGTWIDGKPIYRSVVVVTGNTTRNGAVNLNDNNPITGVESVVGLRGIVMCSDSNQNVWPMPNYYGATTTYNNALFFRRGTGVLRAYFGDNAAYASAKTIIAFIEYTKA